MTQFLTRNDIFRAYQCPEMFAKFVRDGAPEIDPKQIARTFIEDNLPAVLADIRDKGPGYGATAIYSEIVKTWSLSNLYETLHRALSDEHGTPPEFPDIWTREKTLYLGIALWLSKRFNSASQTRSRPIDQTVFEGFRYAARPALKQGTTLTIFELTSSLRSEDDLWSDVALGADIATLIDSLSVAEANGLDGLADELGVPGAFTATEIMVQQIVTGNRAEQWYENPLCRYWRHRDGGMSYSGKVNGTSVRKPAWEKYPVLDVTSTDAMSTHAVEDHVKALAGAADTDPEVRIGEMFPPPLRIGLEDSDGTEWTKRVFSHQLNSHRMMKLIGSVIEEPLIVQNYTACRFPTVCRFWEDCWRAKG